MNSIIAFTVVLHWCSIFVNGHDSIQSSNNHWNVNEHIESPYDYASQSSKSPKYSYTNPCKRECIHGRSLTCYYEFIIEDYEAAGEICARYSNDPARGCIELDGIRTKIITANRQMPGPIIEICVNDTVIVDVRNNLLEDTTVHWHGINQKESPDMDGTPYTSQYPIHPATNFRYKFKVSQKGTYWWHSHSGQRAYGLVGPFISRQPEENDPHTHLYDYDLTDHLIFIQDWSYNFDENNPKNILINGRGHNNVTQFYDNLNKQYLGYQRYRVISGNRYRFRVIYNGNSNCPIQLSIDGHDMLVISSDGQDIEPIAVSSLVVLSAERYDFVVYANGPVENYWMRVKGLGFCESNEIHQGAIIQYKGARKDRVPRQTLTYDYNVDGLQLNPLDVGPSDDPNQVTMAEVSALRYINYNPFKSFKTIYTSMAVYAKDNKFTFQMDDITFTMPKASLLHTRHLDTASTCNKDMFLRNGTDCKSQHCECTNIIELNCYDYYEFVLSSNTATGHPFHSHGYHFDVVGMGVIGEENIQNIEFIDRNNPLPRRTDNRPPYKDTIQVPGYGYTIIRLYTDNCGYWMFHCHLTVHEENGMMSILKVGQPDQMFTTARDNNCFRDDIYNNNYNYFYNKGAK